MDAQRFFDVALPQLASERGELFGSLTGHLAFIVRDVGTWTVRLGDAQVPVREGAEGQADLVLSFLPATFDRFLAGTLNLTQALKDNEVAHDGDLDVLLSFSLFLSGQAPS